MSNRLQSVTAQVRRLSPFEAEVWLVVEAERVSSTTEVRGKVHGPHCPGIATIEAAYPLRPLSQPPEGTSPLARRVVIPDPNRWSAAQPFVYRAIVELWQDGEKCDQRELEIGLRMAGK